MSGCYGEGANFEGLSAAYKRRLWIAIAIAIAIFLTAPASAQQGGNQDYGHRYWDGPWHGWFMGPLVMTLLLVALVFAVVLLVRWFRSRGENRSTGDHRDIAKSPLDILKERFARGEIDKNEYEERRRVLLE